MKSKEEIEKEIDRVLEELGYDCEGDKTADFVDGYVRGYEQCQEDMVKEYTKDDIDEMALDYVINTGGLPQTIGDWKHALWKFYEQLKKQD